jgi:hypothetical protein
MASSYSSSCKAIVSLQPDLHPLKKEPVKYFRHLVIRVKVGMSILQARRRRGFNLPQNGRNRGFNE